MSFRRQVYAALLLLSLLPVMIISGFAMYLSVNSVVTARKSTLITSAETIAHKTGYFISAARHDVISLSQRKNFRQFAESYYNSPADSADEQTVIDELINIVSIDSNYAGAFIMDSDGVVVVSTFPAHDGLNYGKNDFFSRTVNLEQGYVNVQVVNSELSDCILDGLFIFTTRFGIPGSERSAVLALVSNTEVFAGIEKEENPYKTGEFCLINMDGAVIYNENNAAYLNGTKELTDSLSSGETPESGTDRFKYNGKYYISAYKYIAELDFVFRIVVSESEIYSAAYVFFIVMAALIAVTFIIVTYIAKSLSKAMMNPITALRDAFDLAGNSKVYAPCITVKGSSEFIDLANGFNTMIVHINKHQSDTEQALENLRVSEEELRRHNNLIKLERDRTNLLVNRDAVSGVYSRAYFERALENAIKSGRPGALIFIDIDNFKNINDAFSHDFGDKCLKALGTAFSSEELESEVVARISADEFMILKFGLKEDAKECAKRIFNILQKPFIIENISVRLNGSIGVTMFPQDSNEVDVLLKNADLATSQAKLWGKNQYCFYQPSMTTELKAHMDILEMLRTAHLTGDAYLVYQPEVDVKTGQVVAFEALCRAKSETLGFVSPAEFIPLAESSGLIVPLGEWILKNACYFAKSIIDEGIGFNYISVNISQIQINQENFVDLVLATLKETALPANKLQLEITESVLANSTQIVIKKLKKIRSHGIRIALDDFGTGYSSLNYLVHLPIEAVKIDKSFIDHLCTDEKTRIMCDTIIKLGHDLGLSIIAEGTETEEQVVMLKNMGCDMVQGYYYSRPIVSDAAAEYARRDAMKTSHEDL